MQISLKLLPHSFLLFAFEDNELLSRVDLPPQAFNSLYRLFRGLLAFAFECGRVADLLIKTGLQLLSLTLGHLDLRLEG